MNEKHLSRIPRALDIHLSPRSTQHLGLAGSGAAKTWAQSCGLAARRRAVGTELINRSQGSAARLTGILQSCLPKIWVALYLSMVAAVSTASAQVKGIYEFSQPGDPQNPQVVGVIAQGRDGNMYFTTPVTVLNTNNMNPATAFKITPTGKLTPIYTFPTGVQTYSGLTLGTDGDFYGTTYNGGANNLGSIFKLTPKGGFTQLYSFVGGNDGAKPMAPPIEIAGNLYGTATAGGGSNYGTVYQLTPSGKLNPLVQFQGADGADPVAPLVQGSDGRLYGITQTSTNAGGPSVVFSVTTSGLDFTYYAFSAGSPKSEAGLVQGNDGNFYGTMYTNFEGYGYVFKITPSPSYVVTTLYPFGDGADGAYPYAGLLLATDGNFYGVAYEGGAELYGTLYEISQDQFAVPWAFTKGQDGANPLTPLIQNTNGFIYGTTYDGGSLYDYGTFFRFNNHLKPFVSLVSASGKVGTTIGILGQGLFETTGVSFNGTTAEFTKVSDTYLTAVVPSGATTGPVTVTTSTGTLESNKSFNVTP